LSPVTLAGNAQKQAMQLLTRAGSRQVVYPGHWIRSARNDQKRNDGGVAGAIHDGCDNLFQGDP